MSVKGVDVTDDFRALVERLGSDPKAISGRIGIHRTQIGRHLAALRGGEPVRVHHATADAIAAALRQVEEPAEEDAYQKGWRAAVARMEEELGRLKYVSPRSLDQDVPPPEVLRADPEPGGENGTKTGSGPE